MTLLFSDKQQNALNSIWILGIIVAFFQISNYFVDSYGPDTSFYGYLWQVQNWFLESLVFAWYFYKNKLITKAVLIQLLFIPYYIFKSDWSAFLDYHLDIENSMSIYNAMRFVTFFIPLICFAFFYYKTETKPAGISRLKSLIIPFCSALVFSYAVSSDPDSLYKYTGFITAESLYIKDIIVSIIFLVISFKTIAVLIGFLYLSNRAYSIKKLIYPIDHQAISNPFFKWGFMISYTILLLTIMDMVGSIFSISFSSSSLKITTISYILSYLIILIISGRFFGNLIQYRNYTLQKYLGVLNAISMLPILNLISFFVLLFVKKSTAPIGTYVEKLKKNRNIHLIIYAVITILYILYKYFGDPAEYREASIFYRIPVFIIAIVLLSRYKVSTKIVPFLVFIFLYYGDITEFFDFTEGYLSFFKGKILSFIWLGLSTSALVYYIIHYILYKSFYTEYFEEQDAEKFEQYIETFK
ncbi:hypothetical protein SAMN05421820_101786 [Pedobacter steynii]|uniref:Uncharacterized protein n=1 Tax=Pedobacter steynii TaxID=430522 RepID=A0A1G9L6A4_9SPHI|nr:hypothetical protein [Pedobacter steynii]NQX38753.1 hypothetical protein [Pedobacter steynii]SDL57424.1 hypothetical protein SAMN05421820_101786 [Pedobacter steynii]